MCIERSVPPCHPPAASTGLARLGGCPGATRNSIWHFRRSPATRERDAKCRRRKRVSKPRGNGFVGRNWLPERDAEAVKLWRLVSERRASLSPKLENQPITTGAARFSTRTCSGRRRLGTRPSSAPRRALRIGARARCGRRRRNRGVCTRRNRRAPDPAPALRFRHRRRLGPARAASQPVPAPAGCAAPTGAGARVHSREVQPESLRAVALGGLGFGRGPGPGGATNARSAWCSATIS
jgi:hypothetical protein